MLRTFSKLCTLDQRNTKSWYEQRTDMSDFIGLCVCFSPLVFPIRLVLKTAGFITGNEPVKHLYIIQYKTRDWCRFCALVIIRYNICEGFFLIHKTSVKISLFPFKYYVLHYFRHPMHPWILSTNNNTRFPRWLFTINHFQSVLCVTWFLSNISQEKILFHCPSFLSFHFLQVSSITRQLIIQLVCVSRTWSLSLYSQIYMFSRIFTLATLIGSCCNKITSVILQMSSLMKYFNAEIFWTQTILH